MGMEPAPATEGAKRLRIVLGDQLLPIELLDGPADTRVFMAEDLELCTRVRHHQQKLVLFLAAMRAYRDALVARGYDVEYHELDGSQSASYELRLRSALKRAPCSELRHFEIDDRFMEERLARFAAEEGVRRVVLPSPKFLGDGGYFAAIVARGARPHMADFYRAQRRRLGILVAANGTPAGGKWSHDSDNRWPWPRGHAPPARPALGQPASHVAAVQALVKRRFADHPGDADVFWLPTTREQALRWLDDFVVHRLRDFGPYEDAISATSPTLFHKIGRAHV